MRGARKLCGRLRRLCLCCLELTEQLVHAGSVSSSTKKLCFCRSELLLSLRASANLLVHFCQGGRRLVARDLLLGAVAASGVTFVTLEDETGNVNVVVWLDTARRQRKPLLTARLLHVKGVIEKEGDIVHVMAGKLSDLSHLINSLPVSSRDFH